MSSLFPVTNGAMSRRFCFCHHIPVTNPKIAVNEMKIEWIVSPVWFLWWWWSIKARRLIILILAKRQAAILRCKQEAKHIIMNFYYSDVVVTGYMSCTWWPLWCPPYYWYFFTLNIRLSRCRRWNWAKSARFSSYWWQLMSKIKIVNLHQIWNLAGCKKVTPFHTLTTTGGDLSLLALDREKTT